MQKFPAMVLGLLLGCLFTLVLNARVLPTALRGDLSVADLGADVHSADEVYYFALLREGKDGHWSMGNASFRDHANAPAIGGYALLPQAVLVSMGSSVQYAVFFGDLLFPALLTCLYFLLALAFGATRPGAALFAVASMSYWNVGWLRIMNPQVTMTVFLFVLLVFVTDRECRRPWLRALGLGLAMLCQPIHAALLLASEALDAVLSLRSRPIRTVARARYPIAVVAGCVALFLLIASSGTDPEILADTIFRRGLIHSRLPSAPALQLLVLFSGGLWMFRLKKGVLKDEQGRLILGLLIVSLVVLNQSVLHGRDAVFGLYYRMPVGAIISLSLLAFVCRFFSARIVYGFLGAAALLFAASFGRTVMALPPLGGVELETSGIPEALSAVEKLPGERVVLAPLDVSNLVPVLTRHTAFFTQYAHFEYVSDRELAERYVVLGSFFPYLPEHTVEGHPLVFGIGAGNLYARSKFFCRIVRFIGTERGNCDSSVLSDFIRHQDVREFVEKGTIERIQILRKYDVNTIISPDPLPATVKSLCTQVTSAKKYSVYDCDFNR